MQTTRRTSLAAACLLIAATASGSALARKPADPARTLERTPFTVEEGSAAHIERIQDARFAADSIAEFSAAVQASEAAAKQPWLVLSAGGENGAFSAGLLSGWSKAGSRPDFGVVTGISTGALIAPFAFAGPAYDDALRQAYTAITAADIFEFGAKAESLVDTWPLRRLIERQLTPQLLADIAAEHRKGRRLFVVTTNVDTQRPVAWNIGAIAASGGPKARDLIRDVLLASSSIPGIFPPVYIEAEVNGRRFQEMHVDGGVTTPFYLAPDAAILGASDADKMPTPPKVYVIVNNQLTPEFQVTDRMLLAILGRSLSAAVKAGTRAAVAAHLAFAQRRGVDLEIAVIDRRFQGNAKGPFDPGYMTSLYEHGLRVAGDGSAFTAKPFQGAGSSNVVRR